MVFDVCSLASIPKTIPIPPKNSKKNDSFSSNRSIARDRVENCISRETGKLGKMFYLLLNCKRHLFELSLDVEKSF
jgi:hypothetical protein